MKLHELLARIQNSSGQIMAYKQAHDHVRLKFDRYFSHISYDWRNNNMFRGLRFIISFRFTYVFMYSALQLLHLKLCNSKERNSRFNFAFEVEITFHG